MAMRLGFQAVRAAYNDAEREFLLGVPRSPVAARAFYLPAMPPQIRAIYYRHYTDRLRNLSEYGLALFGSPVAADR